VKRLGQAALAFDLGVLTGFALAMAWLDVRGKKPPPPPPPARAPEPFWAVRPDESIPPFTINTGDSA